MTWKRVKQDFEYVFSKMFEPSLSVMDLSREMFLTIDSQLSLGRDDFDPIVLKQQ